MTSLILNSPYATPTRHWHGFGVWAWDVAFEAARILDIIARHSRQP